MKHLFIFLFLFIASAARSQVTTPDSSQVPKKEDRKDLRFNLSQDGSKYFQVTFLNQAWMRYTENNPGTTRFGASEEQTFDIGLRRTRIQMFGQITNRTFIYFQFGQNNFNSAYNYTSNRKMAAFFHDALCELNVLKKNWLKVGGGLTIMNGLSRFSQPSVSTIMTLDVPVFLQYSVDQIDQFDRRLAVYARGQLGRLDYRFYLSNPFPVNSNGSAPPTLTTSATFVNNAAFTNGKGPGVQNQTGTYLSFNLLENEGHTTPYMVGTYLGTKKVWTIAAGAVFQPKATWYLEQNTPVNPDTLYAALRMLSVESFLDIPLKVENRSALSAFAGYYLTDYGNNYLRYNGLMNPATGSTATDYLQSGAYGNAFPMFGTGKVFYGQFGVLLKKQLLGEKHGQLMPYASTQIASFGALHGRNMIVYDLGLNWFIQGHLSKITLNYQNRPTYYMENSRVVDGLRKYAVTLQYQIAI